VLRILERDRPVGAGGSTARMTAPHGNIRHPCPAAP
jgi:hypothetical protein